MSLPRSLALELQSSVFNAATKPMLSAVQTQEALYEQQRQARDADVAKAAEELKIPTVSELASAWVPESVRQAARSVTSRVFPSDAEPVGQGNAVSDSASFVSGWGQWPKPAAPSMAAPSQPTPGSAQAATSTGSGQSVAYNPSAGVEQWNDLVDEASRTYGVPAHFIKGLMEIESGGNPKATSSAGAMGLMQVMCVDEETEALTKRGWLHVDDIAPDDVFMTYDLDSGRSVWQRQVAPINRYPSERVVRMRNNAFDFVVTPNHKWATYRYGRPSEVELRETADLKTGPQYILRSAPYRWDFHGDTYNDAFVQLVGWVFAEGTIPKRGKTSVVLYQKNVASVEAIREIIGQFGSDVAEMPHLGGFRWNIKGETGRKLRDVLTVDKRLPVAFLMDLSTEQAQLLYDAIIDGDGWRYTPKNVEFFVQSHRGRMDDFQTLAVMLGRTPYVFERRTAGRMKILGHERNTQASYQCHVNWRTSVFIPRLTIEEIDEPRAVWCPSLPNGTWVARRHGRVTITGNSFHFKPGEDGMDPRTNIMKGAKVYADALRRYGDPDKAAAAYFGAIDDQGNITSARDATGTDGHRYVRLWRDAASKYGGAPNSSTPAAAAPSSPAPAPAASPQQGAGVGGGATMTGDEVMIRDRKTGGTMSVPRGMVGEGPGQYRSADYEVVDGRQSMSAPALSMKALDEQPQDEPLPGSRRLTPASAPPMDTETDLDRARTRGWLTPGSMDGQFRDLEEINRQPLGDPATPVRDRWADEPQVPYDPDQGPREVIPPGQNEPLNNLQNNLPPDPDLGPREALPGSVGAQPYLGPMSTQPEMAQQSALDASLPPGRIPTGSLPSSVELPAATPEDSIVQDVVRPHIPTAPYVRPAPDPFTERAPFQDDPYRETEPPLPGTPRLPGRVGNRVTHLVENARRSPSQQMDPLDILDIVGGLLPTAVVNEVLTRQLGEGEWTRIAGKDPLAPFRDEAARRGIPLPSPEEVNPDGYPAISVWGGLAASLLVPDPTDPIAGRILGAIGSTGRRVGLPVVTGAAGAVYGGVQPAESLQERADRALAYGAGGGALGAGARAVAPTVGRGAARAGRGLAEEAGRQLLDLTSMPRMAESGGGAIGRGGAPTPPHLLTPEAWRVEHDRLDAIVQRGQQDTPEYREAFPRWYAMRADPPAAIVAAEQGTASTTRIAPELEPAVRVSGLTPSDLQFTRSLDVRPHADRRAEAERLAQGGIGSGSAGHAVHRGGGTIEFSDVVTGRPMETAHRVRGQADTVTHEVGHTIYDALPESLRNEWEEVIHPGGRDPLAFGRHLQEGGERPPTSYAGENAGEDFADSFRVWKRGGIDADTGQPAVLGSQREAFMRKVDEWLNGSQQPQPQAPVSRIRGALDANAERVAAADARMAEGGSTTTAGTFGQSPSFTPPAENAPPFFSQLRRTIEEKMPNRADARQIQGILRGSPVKPDEIAWTGLDDFLAGHRGPVTKQQVLDFLDQNEVRVEEVVKGDRADLKPLIDDVSRYLGMQASEQEARDIATLPSERVAARQIWGDRLPEVQRQFATGSGTTKYGGYTLPGGENYRELLITLPQRGANPNDLPEVKAAQSRLEEINRRLMAGEWNNGALTQERTELEDLIGRVSADHGAKYRANNYRSSHWDEPNILAHVRFNERTAPDGKRVLLIEEVQSDWHQAGRKKGYVGDVSAAQRRYEELGGPNPDMRALREQGLWDEYLTVRREATQPSFEGQVPDAPFKKTWPELAIKRMIRWAAENDFDRIAWPPGAVHAERYNLENHVQSLMYKPNGDGTFRVSAQTRERGGVMLGERLTPEQLEQHVGREVAERIQAGAGESRNIGGSSASQPPDHWTFLSGGDLRVGGEGMKGFYDQILPTTAQKIGKKFGARVGQSEIQPQMAGEGKWVITRPDGSIMEEGPFTTRREAAEYLESEVGLPGARVTNQSKVKGVAVHSMDITPQMRESVLKEGQLLFVSPGSSPARGSGALAQINADVGSSVGSSTFGAAAGAALPADSDEERAQNALRGAGVGLVAGPAASRLMRGRGQGAAATFGFGGRPASEAAASAPDPRMQQMARMLSSPNVPTTPNKRGFLERWAQAMTDDRAGLRTFQEAVSQAIGRPLQAGEMVAELTRRNPASIAGQRLQDELRPALLKVGDDDDYLAQYLTHAHNVDVAREMGQRAYDAAIQAGRTPQQASRAAMQAASTRAFSGDITLAETAQQLQAIEQRVRSLPNGNDRWQAIQDAAQGIWDMNRKTLERKRDAGIISDAFLTELQQRYPRYVRTDIADYFDKGTGAPGGGGKRVGLSDIGIQKISPEGTTKERINPLLSTIEQTYAAESSIARNEAGKAFEELIRLDPSWQATFKEVVPSQGPNRGNPATTVPSSYTLRGKEQFLRVWDGGTERTFVIPGEYAALVSPQAGRILGDNLGANGWRTMMNVYKSLITSKNPAFSLLVSPIRDLSDYAIREGSMSAKSGGPLGALQGAGHAFGALADYARAVPDAFAGILEGTYKGDLARMMREGAGQGSRPRHDLADLRGAYRDLRRTNGLEVRDAGDLLRIAGNVLTLGAEPIGGRIEQIPRLAAARRAARRGASDVGQAMAFRDATVDFQRAGEWSRAINEVVPFFNVAMQGGAQTVRTVRQNPAAALAATAATIGSASVAAEAWNRSDDQRARDYDDVPDYLKKTGIVLMLPGVTGRSERGDQLPNYVWLPVGQYGALVQTAKEAARQTAEGAGGADLSTPAGWASLLNEVGGVFSPLRGESAGAVTTSLIPPGLSTAADLAADRDLYRGSKISTEQRDENASALSQGSAGLFNAVSGQESRPSQWEHFYRDLGGYGATLGLAASNMAAELTGQRRPRDEDRPIQNAPVVGGLVNRLVRDTGGQRMEEAREDRNRVPEGIRTILTDAGVRREEVLAVSSRFKGAQLTRAEQEKWQARTNRLIGEYVRDARGHSDWDDRTKRRELVLQAISKAKQEAASDVLDIGSSDAQDRIDREEARKRRAS